MSKIQINLELDSNETATVRALAALLIAVAEEQPREVNVMKAERKFSKDVPQWTAAPEEIRLVSDGEVVPAEDQPAPTKKRTRKAPEATPEPAPEPTPEPEAEVAPEPEAEAEPEVTLDELRSLLATKVKTHREEIKAKLTELGGSNLTTLPTDKYTAMNDFLKGL